MRTTLFTSSAAFLAVSAALSHFAEAMQVQSQVVVEEPLNDYFDDELLQIES